MPCVDDGKRQQRPAEAGTRPSKVARQREYGPERDGQGRQFDQRIEGAEVRAAVATAAARDQPTKEWNQVAPGERRLAGLAARAVEHHWPEPSSSLDYLVLLDAPPLSSWRCRVELVP